MALSTITLRSSGVSSLQASWEKPLGDVDSYTLTLLQDRCVCGNMHVKNKNKTIDIKILCQLVKRENVFKFNPVKTSNNLQRITR